MFDRQLNISKSNSFFLFGSRGTGKSTLVKGLFPPTSIEYINLLLEKEYYALSQNPDSLIERINALPPTIEWVILDEVQRVPPLLNVVHILIEEKRIKFALTGSSARKLKRGGANLLAGRAFLYELFPLTFQELGSQFDLQSALAWGTLPKLFNLQSDQEKELYLETYVETYLKEEIIAEQLVRKTVPFRRFLDIAVQMNTKLLNYSKISRDVGVSADTIQEYFSILEDTHLGFRMLPYHRSLRKRQVEAPKFYFFDRGIVRALERLPGVPVTPQTSSFGQAFEHLVILEFIRINHYLRSRCEFSFLRTKDGAEIDLIVERPGEKDPILVEIKSSELVRAEDANTIRAFLKDLPKSKAYCLSRDKVSKQIEGVSFLHWRDGIIEILKA